MLVITRSPESSHSSVVLPPLTFIENETPDPDLRRVRKTADIISVVLMRPPFVHGESHAHWAYETTDLRRTRHLLARGRRLF